MTKSKFDRRSVVLIALLILTPLAILAARSLLMDLWYKERLPFLYWLASLVCGIPYLAYGIVALVFWLRQLSTRVMKSSSARTGVSEPDWGRIVWDLLGIVFFVVIGSILTLLSIAEIITGTPPFPP